MSVSIFVVQMSVWLTCLEGLILCRSSGRIRGVVMIGRVGKVVLER